MKSDMELLQHAVMRTYDSVDAAYASYGSVSTLSNEPIIAQIAQEVTKSVLKQVLMRLDAEILSAVDDRRRELESRNDLESLVLEAKLDNEGGLK